MKSRATVVAIVAFVCIATMSAALIVRITAASMNQTAAAQAAQAPEIARLYRAKYGSLDAAAPTIIRSLMRAGLHIEIRDLATDTLYDSGGQRRLPGGPPPLMRGELFARERPPWVRHVHAPPTGLPPGPPGGSFANRDALREGVRFLVAALAAAAGPFVVPIPGAVIVVRIEPDPIFAVIQRVVLGLAIVFAASGTALWLYARGVRRAALRPLLETTLALRRLAQRDFAPRTIVGGGSSAYDELAAAYNDAVEAVAATFAERRAAEVEMQRFIADAGHELRTPLTIVLGYIEIIDGGSLTDPSLVQRVTAGMRTEASRMRKLIDKLIVLARMETPADQDARVEVDAVALVARTIESLEPLASQSIDVTGVACAYVMANEDDVADALTNVIENAIKYAPGAPIVVDVVSRAARVVITITDHGPGMSTEERCNAFERFYRGDKRGEVSGSGLGLPIAKRAIEHAAGTVKLHSVLGRGTTVTIDLPAASVAETRAVDAQPSLASR